ncbi:MAG: sigma-E processing peptidase SpoIIGA [Syntrophomonadaceae bacterium]|nr:sigma-E processing peptidase SpoIIGA [Syntrophomonadaceae bacterium]
METYVVYADITFVVNLIIDFSILWTTGKLARVNLSYPRLVIAALAGAIYAVGFLFCSLFWYGLFMKLLFSFLMLGIAFNLTKFEKFLQMIMYFYGISFLVAGITVGLSFLYETNQYFYTFSYLCLLGGLFSIILLGIYAQRFWEKKFLPNLLKYQVKLSFAEFSCEGSGFLDTGNSLLDPLTNKPVVVAEYQLVKNCLPEDMRRIFENSSSEDELLSRLTESTWSSRLRLIPFSSIGKRNGLLIGIRADEVLINTIKKLIIHKNLTVAIYLDRLSYDGDYEMLIPSKILNFN